MENRYRVYRRENGIYYIEDVVTKQQESLFDTARFESKLSFAASRVVLRSN